MRRFRASAAIAFVARAAPALLIDGCGLTGVGLAVYGCWLIYPPAGFIVAGAAMVATSLWAARAKSR